MIIFEKLTLDLESGLVLIPERYSPRKIIDSHDSVQLSNLVVLVSESFNPKQNPKHNHVVVLDTNSANNGVILNERVLAAAEIGSSKKVVQVGDVIVSRLRPYLRQVALIDSSFASMEHQVVCSTEFYVLRSLEPNLSIAFLVPWLLSGPIQDVLAHSQEGGHHPRFNREALLGLPVPRALIDSSDEINALVAKATSRIRRGVGELERLALGLKR